MREISGFGGESGLESWTLYEIHFLSVVRAFEYPVPARRKDSSRSFEAWSEVDEAIHQAFQCAAMPEKPLKQLVDELVEVYGPDNEENQLPASPSQGLARLECLTWGATGRLGASSKATALLPP